MTNKNLGPNGAIEDSTISALESLGFETTATTGLHQSTFSCTIGVLIPTNPYTDCVTWMKYGCNLFPNASCITDNYEMTKRMQSYMVVFLQTDICSMKGSALPDYITDIINQEHLVVDVKIVSTNQFERVINGFLEVIKKESMKMTTLPLLVLTYLSREQFKKQHVFFDSSLELIQWFEVKMVKDEPC
jgi:hypothetical protein